MIPTLFLTKNGCPQKQISEKIARFCPQIVINNHTSCLQTAEKYVCQEKPELILLDLEDHLPSALEKLNKRACFDFETIVFSPCKSQLFTALKHFALGFVLKPVNVEELILIVHHVERRLQAKRETLTHLSQRQELSLQKVIGIPTIDGYEFIQMGAIIRCEGLQKCTRVITKNRKNIVSSYNIGEFRKILGPYGFFATHKSYLINMGEIVRYFRDGRVQLSDGSEVPVSRRKKNEFLDLLLHL